MPNCELLFAGAPSNLTVERIRTSLRKGHIGIAVAMFFTFPEDARWNAERQAVEYGVEIGAYKGVVRVPRRVFRRLLPRAAHPRAMRRSLLSPENPLRAHRRAEATSASVDRGRECGDQRARVSNSRHSNGTYQRRSRAIAGTTLLVLRARPEIIESTFDRVKCGFTT